MKIEKITPQQRSVNFANIYFTGFTEYIGLLSTDKHA